MSFPIEPIGENVFLERIDDYDGAMVANVAPVFRDKQGLRARVVAAGPGKSLPDGSCAPMGVGRGDVVMIGRASGAEINLAGQDLVAIRESDILAVLEYAH